MAQIDSGRDVALRMDQLDLDNLFAGVALLRSNTALSISSGNGGYVNISGHSFTFDANGVPTGGTILAIEIEREGSTTFQSHGQQTDLAALYALVSAGDGEGALDLLLARHDNIHGSEANDYLIGGDEHDNLFGAGGADTIDAGAGNDHLFGSAGGPGPDGADSLLGGDGGDYIQGNAGDDTLDGGAGSDRIKGGADADLIFGGDGNDSINGNRGDDEIDGGFGNDFLRGGQDQDILAGGDGNDLLTGDLGSDTLSGGLGHDLLSGGDGDDVLAGDLGSDTLTGGAGIDTFSFTDGSSISSAGPADVVSDFEDGVDLLAIGYVPTTVLTGAAQPSVADAALLAQQLFDANAGDHEVAAIGVGSDTYLFYSSDGGASADSAILLTNVSADSISSIDLG